MNLRRAAAPLRNWRSPVVTTVGMVAVIALVALVEQRPGPLVLGAALAMTLSRSHLIDGWRGRIEAILVLPAVAVATAGVGRLLRFVPVVGAIAFVAAMFLAIWLRRFGSTGRRIGSLIALPFVTLLIAPATGATVLGVVLISLLALVVVVAIRVVAEAVGMLRLPIPAPQAAPRASILVPIASTRMAIQLAIALAAAFVLGFLVFPDHVTWVVLTAYLVCSGNRGRADVLYKSGLRVVGAVAGTIVAIPIVVSDGIQGPGLVALLLAIVAVGLWLREASYAFWALAMTLVVALLQGALGSSGSSGAVDAATLVARILAILVGALCGLAASWFVLPIRSEPVMRLRIAHTLAALSDYLADSNPATEHSLRTATEQLELVSPPWIALARITPRRPISPGEWARLTKDCVRLGRAIDGQPAASVRRSLGEARRATKDRTAITTALNMLRDELAAGQD